MAQQNPSEALRPEFTEQGLQGGTRQVVQHDADIAISLIYF